jgi:hypothetical protein
VGVEVVGVVRRKARGAYAFLYIPCEGKSSRIWYVMVMAPSADVVQMAVTAHHPCFATACFVGRLVPQSNTATVNSRVNLSCTS